MSLRQQVQRRAVAVNTGALLFVGVLLSIVLHTRAVTALDTALVAAAQAHSDAHQEPDWVVAGGGERAFPVEFIPDGSTLPVPAWFDGILGSPVPQFHDHNRTRWVIVDVAASTGATVDPALPHIAVAWSPAVTWQHSVGTFVPAYLGIASLAALIASLVLRPLLASALRPLELATASISQVVGAGGLAPLSLEGPPEVTKLLEAVNALLSRLESASRSQARFTADAAHELRTPVTALRGELDVALRRDRDADAYRMSLTRAHETVVRLSELVEALLALSQVDSGTAHLDRTSERASALAHEALRQELPGLRAAGVTVRVVVEQDPEVAVHVPLVVAALANLLRNVARHAPGSHAILTVKAHQGMVELAVEDDGPGLGNVEAETLMARFARGSSDAGGIGLGLPLAAEIARRHGGTCTLHPRSPKGTRAVLTLRGS